MSTADASERALLLALRGLIRRQRNTPSRCVWRVTRRAHIATVWSCRP